MPNPTKEDIASTFAMAIKDVIGLNLKANETSADEHKIKQQSAEKELYRALQNYLNAVHQENKLFAFQKTKDEVYATCKKVCDQEIGSVEAGNFHFSLDANSESSQKLVGRIQRLSKDLAMEISNASNIKMLFKRIWNCLKNFMKSKPKNNQAKPVVFTREVQVKYAALPPNYQGPGPGY